MTCHAELIGAETAIAGVRIVVGRLQNADVVVMRLRLILRWAARAESPMRRQALASLRYAVSPKERVEPHIGP
jgi:hypothetical protein